MKLLMGALAFLLAIGVVQRSFAQANDHGEVVVLDKSDKLPDSAKFIDNLKAGGVSGGCSYSEVMDAAKKKAIKKGGNLVKITELKCPGRGGASCFRLRADIYSMPDVTGLIKMKDMAQQAVLSSLLPDTASYALLCVYRPNTGVGALVAYNLHVNDSDVCRVRNGSQFTIKLFDTGETWLWARTETRKELKLNVEHGKVYYLRCSVRMGMFVGEPEFKFMNTYDGYQEFVGCGFGDAEPAEPPVKK